MNPEDTKKMLAVIKGERAIHYDAISKLNAEESRIIGECQHDIVKNAVCGSATCSICGVGLGWYCEESPDKHCHYDNKHGEECIYCGAPEERK